MENGKATENTITRSLQNFEIHLNRNIPKSTRNTHSTLRSSILPIEKPKPPSLVGSCLGVVGKHFEDIIEDLGDIASNFPADIKEVRVTRESRRQEKTIKKLVVDTETNKVLGASMCGPDAAEIMQGNVVHTSTISEYDLGGEGDLFKAPEAIIEEPAVGFDPMTAAISMGPLDDY